MSAHAPDSLDIKLSEISQKIDQARLELTEAIRGATVDKVTDIDQARQILDRMTSDIDKLQKASVRLHAGPH